MYHYVRKGSDKSPYFIHLDVDDFEKQIDYLLSNYKILSKEEFEKNIKNKSIINDGIVLTFDDGLSDHYEYVYPILTKKNLWGIFYIPTFPYQNKQLLDVHRIHYLLGKYGGENVLDKLSLLIKSKDFIKSSEKLFGASTYLKQDNDFYTTKVKQIINYYLQPHKRSDILKKLLDIFKENENEICKNFYLTKSQINLMIEGGMSIGNHGHSHTLFSNLSDLEQCNEIITSNDILSDLTDGNDYKSFCYPYGGKQSYNNYTLKCLNEYNFTFAFSVESKDIEVSDIIKKYELPRYDCNEFMYGKATKGKK
jgi:peptidoglycan/xylan/chitin deacetylase (PgdA/CDA1 family)